MKAVTLVQGRQGDREEGTVLESSGSLVPGSSRGPSELTLPFSHFWPQSHFSILSPAGQLSQRVTPHISQPRVCCSPSSCLHLSSASLWTEGGKRHP